MRSTRRRRTSPSKANRCRRRCVPQEHRSDAVKYFGGRPTSKATNARPCSLLPCGGGTRKLHSFGNFTCGEVCVCAKSVSGAPIFFKKRNKIYGQKTKVIYVNKITLYIYFFK